MSSRRLWSPAGTRRTANKSEGKQQTPKNILFRFFCVCKEPVLCCHSNPKSNALIGFVSVKSADLCMMPAELLLTVIKVRLLKTGIHLNSHFSRLRSPRPFLNSLGIRSIGKKTLLHMKSSNCPSPRGGSKLLVMVDVGKGGKKAPRVKLLLPRPDPLSGCCEMAS